MNTTSAYASLNPLGGHNVSSISFSNEEMTSYFNLGGDVVELPLPHVATAVALMVGYYMIFVLSIHLIGHARLCMNNFLRAPPAYIVCASFVVVFSLLCNHLPASNASTDTIILSTLFIWLCIFLEMIYVHLIIVHRSLAHDMVVADDNNVVDNAGMPEVVVQYENFNNDGLGWRFFNFNWLFTLLGIAIVYYFSNSNNVVAELQSIIRLNNWLFSPGNAIVYYLNNMVAELQVIIRLTKDLNKFWDEVVNYFDTIFVHIGSSVSASHIAVIVFGIPITYYFCNIYKPAAYVNTIMSDDSDSDYLPAETVNIFNQLINQDDDEEADEEEVVDFAAEHDLAVVEDEQVEVVVAAQQQEDTVEMKKAKKLERIQKQLSSELSNYWTITSPTRRRA